MNFVVDKGICMQSNNQYDLHDQDEQEKVVDQEQVELNEPSNLEVCQQEAALWKDQYARVSADFENYKKRMDREQVQWMQTAQTMVIKDLLTVVDNFERAFLLLREVMQIIQERKLSPLEQEGVIQRFEYTWELTWKVLKDYLEYSGIVFDIIAPRSVIKEAIAAKVIDNGDIWMDALDSRNKMSHTYSYKDFEKIITSIEKNYYPELDNFYLKMLKISTKIDSNRA